MATQTGKLDRRLTLQTLTTTRGAEGGIVETWADLATVWAERLEETSREYRAAGARHTDISRVFRIRHRAGLGSGANRVVYESQEYDLIGVREEGRKEGLILSCREVQKS